jgi:hypothetical protein
MVAAEHVGGKSGSKFWRHGHRAGTQPAGEQIGRLAFARPIRVGENYLIFTLTRIGTEFASRLVFEHRILNLTFHPLRTLVRQENEKVAIRLLPLGSEGDERATFVAGVQQAASRSAGGPPKPSVPGARVPMRARGNRLEQTDLAASVIHQREAKARALIASDG